MHESRDERAMLWHMEARIDVLLKPYAGLRPELTVLLQIGRYAAATKQCGKDDGKPTAVHESSAGPVCTNAFWSVLSRLS